MSMLCARLVWRVVSEWFHDESGNRIMKYGDVVLCNVRAHVLGCAFCERFLIYGCAGCMCRCIVLVDELPICGVWL